MQNKPMTYDPLAAFIMTLIREKRITAQEVVERVDLLSGNNSFTCIDGKLVQFSERASRAIKNRRKVEHYSKSTSK